MSDFQLLDEAPPTAVATGDREYTRYAEQADILRANVGKWGKLSAVELTQNEGTTAEEAERAARKRAGNRAAMVKQRTGSWKGADWATRIAQPGGPGTPFEIWVSCVRVHPAPEPTPAAQNGTAPAEAAPAAEADVQADASVSDAPEAPEAAAEPTPEAAPEAEAAPRRRRG